MINTLPHSPQTQRLLAARGPFASIYFDDSHCAPDAAAQLGVRWRDIRRELEDQGAQATAIAALEQAVHGERPRVGRSGHGLIACADGVVIDEYFVVPPTAPLVRVSELPYVVPLVQYGPVFGTYLVVAVDHIGAEVTLHQGNTVRCETIEAGGYPVHKAAVAGFNGWGEQQHRVDEAIRRNVRAVAQAITDEIDRHNVEVVFVIGQDRVRAELMSALPGRASERVVQSGVGGRHTGINGAVNNAIALEFHNRRGREAAAAADRFRAEVGRESGLAVAGIAGVCTALRGGGVAELIIGDIAEQTVLAGDDFTLIAPDADTLSSFGVAPTRTLRADEAIPYAALAGGAALVRADDNLAVLEGIAALLRFSPPGY